jgi:hypothetical protein
VLDSDGETAVLTGAVSAGVDSGVVGGDAATQ